MLREESFQDLLRRIRAGDQEAATELVRRFEPGVRGAARKPLQEMKLSHLVDSADISQAVLANFFSRAADGRFELHHPEQLFGLLVTMARNKVRDEARRQRTQRREARRVHLQHSDHCLEGIIGGEPTPSRIVSGQELAAEVARRLSDEARHLVDERAAGRPWAELAAEKGTTPAALRKRLARELERVAAEVGLSEASEPQ